LVIEGFWDGQLTCNDPQWMMGDTDLGRRMLRVLEKKGGALLVKSVSQLASRHLGV